MNLFSAMRSRAPLRFHDSQIHCDIPRSGDFRGNDDDGLRPLGPGELER